MTENEAIVETIYVCFQANKMKAVEKLLKRIENDKKALNLLAEKLNDKKVEK